MIHCYKLGGLNIVLDIFSGSVHVVDEVAYDIIEMYESESRENIIEKILAKYPERDDVTKEEIEGCFEQLEERRLLAVSAGLDAFRTPMPTAAETLVVTASVGHVPRTRTRTGFSRIRPFMRIESLLFFFSIFRPPSLVCA